MCLPASWSETTAHAHTTSPLCAGRSAAASDHQGARVFQACDLVARQVPQMESLDMYRCTPHNSEIRGLHIEDRRLDRGDQHAGLVRCIEHGHSNNSLPTPSHITPSPCLCSEQYNSCFELLAKSIQQSGQFTVMREMRLITRRDNDRKNAAFAARRAPPQPKADSPAGAAAATAAGRSAVAEVEAWLQVFDLDRRWAISLTRGGFVNLRALLQLRDEDSAGLAFVLRHEIGMSNESDHLKFARAIKALADGWRVCCATTLPCPSCQSAGEGAPASTSI